MHFSTVRISTRSLRRCHQQLDNADFQITDSRPPLTSLNVAVLIHAGCCCSSMLRNLVLLSPPTRTAFSVPHRAVPVEPGKVPKVDLSFSRRLPVSPKYQEVVYRWDAEKHFFFKC